MAGPAPTPTGEQHDQDKPYLPHLRRVVQVHRVVDQAADALFTTVVCNDGSVWGMVNAGLWERLPDVPQDEPEKRPSIAGLHPSQQGAPRQTLGRDHIAALKQVLSSAAREMEDSGRWGYFTSGGWGGERIREIIAAIDTPPKPAQVAPAQIAPGAALEEQVLSAFADYWRANYPDGVRISNSEWHLPKLQGAIKRALRTLTPLAAVGASVEGGA